jgi:ABC-type nitrate/sulfonate/bicarbonate transport system permease component
MEGDLSDDPSEEVSRDEGHSIDSTQMALMKRLARGSYSIVPLALIVAIWQLAAIASPMQFMFIGSPLRLVSSIPAYYSRDASMLWVDLQVTMIEMLVGLVLGAGVGTVVGLAMALSRAIRETLRPIVIVFNSIPKVALAPLVIVWFGFGTTGKIVLVMLIAIVIFALNVSAAAEQADRIWFDHVAAMGARQLQQIVLVLLPATLPGILTSFRQAIGNCFRMVVFAEFIGSSAGLGYALLQYSNALDFRGVLIVVGALLAMSLVLDEAAKAAESYTQRWRAA